MAGRGGGGGGGCQALRRRTHDVGRVIGDKLGTVLPLPSNNTLMWLTKVNTKGCTYIYIYIWGLF